MQLLTDDQFDRLFTDCKRDAFHLEVRDTYAVSTEFEPLQRFLAGETADPSYAIREWITLIQSMTRRGVAVSRVRVVSVPHSDYQRWLFAVTASNVAAGEDIRYVQRSHAGEVPPDDWWLIDDEAVAFNTVDQDGRSQRAAMTTDPRIVQYCQSVRARLWGIAIPYAEYVAGFND